MGAGGAGLSDGPQSAGSTGYVIRAYPDNSSSHRGRTALPL